MDGNFYYEVQANQQCDANDKNTNYDRDGKGLVKIGRACWGCYEGNVSFESNQSVWVTYDEKVGEKLGDDIGIMILGFVGGFGSICSSTARPHYQNNILFPDQIYSHLIPQSI